MLLLLLYRSERASCLIACLEYACKQEARPLRFKEKFRMRAATYGVTSDGGGWRKDVVNRCLEFGFVPCLPCLYHRPLPVPSSLAPSLASTTVPYLYHRPLPVPPSLTVPCLYHRPLHRPLLVPPSLASTTVSCQYLRPLHRPLPVPPSLSCRWPLPCRLLY